MCYWIDNVEIQPHLLIWNTSIDPGHKNSQPKDTFSSICKHISINHTFSKSFTLPAINHTKMCSVVVSLMIASGADFVLLSKLFSEKFHDVSMFEVFFLFFHWAVVFFHIHGKLVGSPGGGRSGPWPTGELPIINKCKFTVTKTTNFPWSIQRFWMPTNAVKRQFFFWKTTKYCLKYQYILIPIKN